jgi:hypothetical protein
LWNICAKFKVKSWAENKLTPHGAGWLHFLKNLPQNFSLGFHVGLLGETRFWQDLSACTMKKMDIGA